MIKALLATATLPALFFATSAAAQDQGEPKEPRRVRVGLGPQVLPKFPGSEDLQFGPMVEVSIARGDTQFEFSSADQSPSFALIDTGTFAIGPVANLVSSRRRDEVDLPVDEVGITVEAGGFAELWFAPSLRLHGEVRKGLSGHRGVVGDVRLDFVARDNDNWLFSVGPRVAFGDRRYQDAWFGVSPTAAARTGLAAYEPNGGLHAAGASATTIYQFDKSWGISGYVKYDRLLNDAADSPIVRTIGSRDQFSGGAALTFTFGGNR